ncbi:hypothetical protein A3762_06480 [Oleiphilus sp. HI0125]|nr:apolipoprotein N-acyltransferase [Oleiphilus sp. HI0125]KZZ58813.1 hypothetical protein A3762_06480 [Oleiphilus sp. HI0125]
MKGSIFLFLSACASGALYAFANVGFGLWLLAFACFVPLLLALERSKRFYSSALTGFAMGSVLYFVGYSWLLALSDGFIRGEDHTGSLLWLAYGFVIALHFAVFALLYVAMRRLNVGILLSSMAALLIIEFTQANLFPFYLGASLVRAPYLAQAADLGGVYLLSACVISVNACCVVLLQERRFTSMKSIASTVGIVGGLYFYGVYQVQQEESFVAEPQQQMSIGLVQSDIYGMSRPDQRATAHQQHLAFSRSLIAQHEIDLLVWPEAAYGRAIQGTLPVDAQPIQQDLDTPIVFGATRLSVKQGRLSPHNAVFLIDENNRVASQYSKNILIPFSEYLPFETILSQHESFVAQVFPEYSRFEAGDSLTALTFKGRRISTPICYETVIPELVREMVANNHAELIISVANDSWFGMSKEPYIHLAMAKLRAIEHRRWFVRATNGGISAVINPAGRVVNNVPLGEEGVRASIVDWRSEQTLYTLYGNWFVSVVMGLTLLTLLTRGAIFRVKKSSELDFKQRASLTK